MVRSLSSSSSKSKSKSKNQQKSRKSKIKIKQRKQERSKKDQRRWDDWCLNRSTQKPKTNTWFRPPSRQTSLEGGVFCLFLRLCSSLLIFSFPLDPSIFLQIIRDLTMPQHHHKIDQTHWDQDTRLTDVTNYHMSTFSHFCLRFWWNGKNGQPSTVTICPWIAFRSAIIVSHRCDACTVAR